MNDKESVAYMVKCPFDTKHMFPVTLEKGKEKKEAGSRFEAWCPFCDKYVQVTIDSELIPDKAVLRGFGFKEEES